MAIEKRSYIRKNSKVDGDGRPIYLNQVNTFIWCYNWGCLRKLTSFYLLHKMLQYVGIIFLVEFMSCLNIWKVVLYDMVKNKI